MEQSQKKFNYKPLYNVYREGKHPGVPLDDAFLKECRKELFFNSYQKALASDRTRILYCPAFRRLQQKAQVFSLETNSNVRSRLTHSLEVADLGLRLSDGITHSLRDRKKGNKTIPGFKDAEMPIVAAIVENACLFHDIGNPPFGHFGEAAIQDWAKNSGRKLSRALVDRLAREQGLSDDDKVRYSKWIDGRMADFREFDGNPQGFRTVTKLFGDNGLNLTCATLLCGLKYARTTGVPKGKGILKKAGYFQTEAALVERLHTIMGRDLGTRYPLTYVMEAADDIAYCMSDIADGIEKRILTEEEFAASFLKHWRKLWKGEKLPKEIQRYFRKDKRNNVAMTNFNQDFSIPWSTEATKEAVAVYVEKEDEIMAGKYKSLMSNGGRMSKVLDTIGEVSKEILYPSIEAESIELTGYAVITGILRHFERLLMLPTADFERLVAGDDEGLAVQRRLLNRIVDSGCVGAYKCAVKELDKAHEFYELEEWWLRVHLLIDYISSMTDAFALETYQMLEGIALMKT